jgi:2'-5' RNA ligase
LHEINKELSELPHTTNFPDYHPHATVAYLKKGKAADYIKQLEDISFDVTPSKIVYSKPDGSKTEQPLN